MLDIRWYGRGGQGAFTVARMLGLIVTVYGKSHALAYPSFGPERRGAPVWSFTRIDKEKIIDRSEPTHSDYLIILDETLVTEAVFRTLRPEGVVILNTARPEKYRFIKHQLITLDATKMAMEIIGKPIANIAMLGAFAGATGLVDLAAAEKALERTFSPALFAKNKNVLLHAYREVKGADKLD